MILPFEVVIESNTIASNGLITFRIVDAAGAIAVASQQHKFPVGMPTVVLLQMLETVIQRAEQRHVSVAAGARLRFTAAGNAANVADVRTAANALTTKPGVDGVHLRAVMRLVLSEFNVLRGIVTTMKADCSAATSIGDLRTRAAAWPATPDRTVAQLVTAFENTVNSGSAD